MLARGEAECYICLETTPAIVTRSARYGSTSRGKYSTLCLMVLLLKVKHNSTLSSCMASCNSMYYPCWEQPTSSISNSISCFSIYNRQKYHSIFIASDSRSTGLDIPGSPLPSFVHMKAGKQK